MKKIAMILVVSLFLFSCSSSTESNTFKIGVISPLTGAGANLGVPYVEGMEMAVNDLKRDGKNIEILVQDSKLEPKTSVDAVRYLLNTEDPDLFISIFSGPSIAISPLLKEVKKPLIYDAFSRSVLDNPYAYKSNFDSLIGCESLIRFAKDNDYYEKLGVIVPKNEPGELCLQGIKKVDPLVSEYLYSFGEKDFRTLLTKANNDGIDRLATVAIDYEYFAFFAQLAELGYPIKMICATATECIFPEIVSSAPSELLNGTLSVDFAPMDLHITDFAMEYLEGHPEAIRSDLVYAALGHDLILYAARVYKDCEILSNHKCMKESMTVPLEESLLKSSGFKNRVLQFDYDFYEYKGGAWQSL